MNQNIKNLEINWTLEWTGTKHMCQSILISTITQTLKFYPGQFSLIFVIQIIYNETQEEYSEQWHDRGQVGCVNRSNSSCLSVVPVMMAHVFFSVKALSAPSQGQSLKRVLLRSLLRTQRSTCNITRKVQARGAPKSLFIFIAISLPFRSIPGRLKNLVTYIIIYSDH